MTRLCLPASVEGDAAAAHFSRPSWKNLWGLLAKRVRVAMAGVPDTRVPPFVERLWLPAYAVSLHTTSKQGDRVVWASVEAVSGEVTLMDCAEQLAICEIGEDSFPPEISEAGAVELARKGLLRYVMAQRGQSNKPVVDAVEEIRLYHFPVWVLYYLRRGTFLDIKVLDAYSGKSAGAKMRVTVLNALVAAKKRTRG